MAVTLNPDLDVRRGEVKRVYPEDVILDWHENGRAWDPDPARIAEMKRSLLEHGQIQPVVFALTHDRRLKLSSGYYRTLAMREINLGREPDQRMRLEGIIKDGNEYELFLTNIAENRDRTLTTVVDDAHNVRRLREQFGKSDDEIRLIYASEVNPDGSKKPMSVGWLENMRKIVTLPEDLQRRITKNQLSASIGYMLADMAPEEREPTLQAAAAGGKLTTTTVLKAARERGSLSKPAGLKMPEVRAAFTYLAEEHPNPKLKRFAQLQLEWVNGRLSEPDFFRKLQGLISG